MWWIHYIEPYLLPKSVSSSSLNPICPLHHHCSRWDVARFDVHSPVPHSKCITTFRKTAFNQELKCCQGVQMVSRSPTLQWLNKFFAYYYFPVCIALKRKETLFYLPQTSRKIVIIPRRAEVFCHTHPSWRKISNVIAYNQAINCQLSSVCLPTDALFREKCLMGS